ncbi:MAG: divalent-cation tolerance protein CutA [Candidatus Omnitrophica bacterium]|nr:divalent-cation tolerance protein CutA [Candidatus Omnitrophota bacterium]
MAVEICIVYVTTRDKDEALKISRHLTEKKLIACANIFDGILSVYEWEGRLLEEKEAVIVMKTRKELFADVEKEIKTVHSYTTPCIVSIPMTSASGDFAEWVMNQTSRRG